MTIINSHPDGAVTIANTLEITLISTNLLPDEMQIPLFIFLSVSLLNKSVPYNVAPRRGL